MTENGSSSPTADSTTSTILSTAGGATSPAPEMTTTEQVTTSARPPDDGPVLWAGVKPEYIIIPCILLGIPALVFIYCMIKAAITRSVDGNDELLKDKKARGARGAPSASARRKSRSAAATKGKDKKRKPKDGAAPGRNSVSPTELN